MSDLVAKASNMTTRELLAILRIGHHPMIPARDFAALERIAAKGYRVTVEGKGVRRVVEPVDTKPDDVQASDPFEAVEYRK